MTVLTAEATTQPMSRYFYVLDYAVFHARTRPALAAARQARSFSPCQSLCADLLPAMRGFRERFHLDEEMLIAQVARGLSFDRDRWRLLVGEMLLVSAVEIPEIETAPETWTWLLAPEQRGSSPPARADFAPIQQALFGSRDLTFGLAVYRPDHAGWNDDGDVRRLASYLASVDVQQWTANDLAGLESLADDEDRAEELEYAREWLADLVDLYHLAAERGNIIVCEVL